MGTVTEIGARRRRQVIKPADSGKSEHVGVRVSVDIFRRMTEMVESPDYIWRTKSDLLCEAIELLFDKYEDANPDDAGWTRYRIHRAEVQRGLRDEDLEALERLFRRQVAEHDYFGHVRLLRDCRQILEVWIAENANEFELGKLRALITAVETCVREGP